MEWKRIEGNWKLVRSNIRKKWAKLTDEDLSVIDGRRDELEDKIQQRYGFATEHVRKEVDEWVRWQPEPRRKAAEKSPLT
jgi:uncharacterized protein YjbJ (UPF0337 family)